jgi:hypothetical protein
VAVSGVTGAYSLAASVTVSLMHATDGCYSTASRLVIFMQLIVWLFNEYLRGYSYVLTLTQLIVLIGRPKHGSKKQDSFA